MERIRGLPKKVCNVSAYVRWWWKARALPEVTTPWYCFWRYILAMRSPSFCQWAHWRWQAARTGRPASPWPEAGCCCLARSPWTCPAGATSPVPWSFPGTQEGKGAISHCNMTSVTGCTMDRQWSVGEQMSQPSLRLYHCATAGTRRELWIIWW